MGTRSPPTDQNVSRIDHGGTRNAPRDREEPVLHGDVDRVGSPQAGTIRYQPGARLGPILRLSYMLVVLHRGRLTIEIDGEAHELHAGEVALVKPGHREQWRFAPDTPSRQSWLSLPRPALSPGQLAALDAAPFSLRLSNALARLVDAGIALSEELPTVEAGLAAVVTTALLVYIEEAHHCGLLSHTAAEPPALLAVWNFLRHHLHERITLKDMAAAAHVTPEHLIRLFHRELGTTPMRYLWAHRVRKGVYLLEHTTLSVGEVAAQTGFQTSQHFSRAVRASTGLSPREVRRRRASLAVTPV